MDKGRINQLRPFNGQRGSDMKKAILAGVLVVLAAAFLMAPSYTQFLPDIILTKADGNWLDTRIYANFTDVLTAVNLCADPVTVVVIREETYDNDGTWPAAAEIVFRGKGKITQTAGTLNMWASRINAPDRTVFSTTGAGSFDFADGAVVHSSWFDDFDDAVDVTQDDTLTLRVDGWEAVTSSEVLGSDVVLRFDNVGDFLYLNTGVVLSGVSMLEAGRYQILRGPGRLDFEAGSDLKTSWFERFDEAIRYIDDSETTLVIDKVETLVANTTTDIGTHVVGTKGNVLTTTAPLVISGTFEAGEFQTFAGAGIVDLALTLPKVAWWGAVGDGVTDSTTAIQNAINCAARNDTMQTLFGAGEYLFSRLYIHHDPANNPNFQATDNRGGRVHLIGVGRSDTMSVNAGFEVGTRLRSTDATGPAIYAFGDPNGTGAWAANVRIEDMMVEADNTTRVIEFRSVNKQVGLDNVLVLQHGTGGGIKHWNKTWFATSSDVFVKQQTGGKSGIGWQIMSETGETEGGIRQYRNCQVHGFDTGWEVSGLVDDTVGLATSDFKGCEASSNNTGVFVGDIHGFEWANGHFEANTDIGILLKSKATTGVIRNNFFWGNGVSVQVGTGLDDGDDKASHLLFSQNYFSAGAGTTVHYKIFTGGNTDRIVLSNEVLTCAAWGLDHAIELEDDHYYGLVIQDCENGGFTQLIADSLNNDMTDRVPFLRGVAGDDKTNTQYWGTSTGAPNAVPFWFKQFNAGGGFAPLGLYQADVSQPVLKMEATGEMKLWIRQDAVVADGASYSFPDATDGLAFIWADATAGGGTAESMVCMVQADGTCSKVAGTTNTFIQWAGEPGDYLTCRNDGATACGAGNMLDFPAKMQAFYFYHE